MTHMNNTHDTQTKRLNNCKHLSISVSNSDPTSIDVVFASRSFAFAAYYFSRCAYIRAIQRDAPLLRRPREGTPCNHDAWRSVMKFLSRLFGSHREMNLTTALERQRLGRTMPGQTGAVAGARLDFLV